MGSDVFMCQQQMYLNALQCYGVRVLFLIPAIRVAIYPKIKRSKFLDMELVLLPSVWECWVLWGYWGLCVWCGLCRNSENLGFVTTCSLPIVCGGDIGDCGDNVEAGDTVGIDGNRLNGYQSNDYI